MAGKTRPPPNWSEVKARLAHFDRAGLIGLLGDLHNLSRDNQAFFHARLGLGADPLTPYKRTISRWIYPDLMRNQDISVAKAKKAIADYRKAIGLPEGVADLSVFYCENAARLSAECGIEDEGYFMALVGMFDQALVATMALAPDQREQLLARLDRARLLTDAVGWGVKDAMDEIWADNVVSDRRAWSSYTFADIALFMLRDTTAVADHVCLLRYTTALHLQCSVIGARSRSSTTFMSL